MCLDRVFWDFFRHCCISAYYNQNTSSSSILSRKSRTAKTYSTFSPSFKGSNNNTWGHYDTRNSCGLISSSNQNHWFPFSQNKKKPNNWKKGQLVVTVEEASRGKQKEVIWNYYLVQIFALVYSGAWWTLHLLFKLKQQLRWVSCFINKRRHFLEL